MSNVRDEVSSTEAAADLRRSEARYRTLVAATAFDVWRAAPDGAVIADMPAWRSVTGQDEEHILGDGWLDAIVDADRERVRARWYHSVETGEPYECEYAIATEAGGQRVVFARGYPLWEDGSIVEWVGVAHDVTEQRQAEEELREQHRTVEQLREIGSTLSAELKVDGLVQELTDATTQLCGAEFGAFFYNAEDEKGDAYLLYTLSGAPKEAFASFPPPRATDVFAPTFAGEAPVRSDDITADPRYGRNAPYHGMPKGHLPVRSYLAVPVISRTGEVHGGLFFGHAEPARFTARHERLVVAVAAQAATALDNARLYEAERTARAAAEAARTQLQVLAAAAESLSADLDAEETAGRLTRLVAPVFADWAAVHLSQGNGHVITLGSVNHPDRTEAERIRKVFTESPVSHDSLGPIGTAIRTGEVQHVEITPESLRLVDGDDAAKARIAVFGSRWILAVPLTARGRTVGALSLFRAGDEGFNQAEIDVVIQLARRAGLALDNAILFTREREAALALQRSLLPNRPPALPGCECAVRYQPGASGTEVGGDWYDVIELTPECFGIVVGDVQGRGAPAAAVMGQLRSVVRAFAIDDPEPAELLQRVDRVVVSLGEHQLITCVYARYDTRTREIVVASAGHLPPVLVGPRGDAEAVELEPGLPLGVGGATFAQRRLELPEGGSLLLFTDGLVEGPDLPIAEGLDRLISAVASSPGGGEVMANTVLASLTAGDDHDDDIALLVLTSVAAAAERWVDLPADPAAVRDAREVVGDVVERAGLGELRDSIELLTSEVVTNAIRHARSSVRLRISCRDRRCRVDVHDRGVGVLPRRTPPPVTSMEPDASGHDPVQDLAEGGRGLLLVDALATAWGVEPDEWGKVVWFELSGS